MIFAVLFFFAIIHPTFQEIFQGETLIPVIEEEGILDYQNRLNFFSYRDIITSLRECKARGNTYVRMETVPELEKNSETATGIARKINFEIFPFFFPPPISPSTWKIEDLDLDALERRAFPPLTVLTKPVGGSFIAEHAGVANSARRGLKQVASDYNFNPDELSDVKKHVVVITDLRAGMQAYEWKKENQIQSLQAGPNFAPSEGNFFIAWPLMDSYLCNSEWPAKNLCRMNRTLEGRIRYWFAGVDETYWKPTVSLKEKKSNRVLLYCKTDGNVSEEAKRILERKGYEVIVIGYGGYWPEEFRRFLDDSLFAVFVSRSESQGIALAEAWSMDVPVLAWNPKVPFDWDGHTWTDVSSCPYMNPKVGCDWYTFEELEKILDSFDQIRDTFAPRRWVLLHMTDKISIETLFTHIREMENR